MSGTAPAPVPAGSRCPPLPPLRLPVSGFGTPPRSGRSCPYLGISAPSNQRRGGPVPPPRPAPPRPAPPGPAPPRENPLGAPSRGRPGGVAGAARPQLHPAPEGCSGVRDAPGCRVGLVVPGELEHGWAAGLKLPMLGQRGKRRREEPPSAPGKPGARGAAVPPVLMLTRVLCIQGVDANEDVQDGSCRVHHHG